MNDISMIKEHVLTSFFCVNVIFSPNPIWDFICWAIILFAIINKLCPYWIIVITRIGQKNEVFNAICSELLLVVYMHFMVIKTNRLIHVMHCFVFYYSNRETNSYGCFFFFLLPQCRWFIPREIRSLVTRGIAAKKPIQIVN